VFADTEPIPTPVQLICTLPPNAPIQRAIIIIRKDLHTAPTKPCTSGSR
jgi:hypothetical protein